MSTKISDLTAVAPPLASDDLIAVVDTGAAATKSVRADQSKLYSKTSLTTGQILALNGTPIELVAAPGVGKVIVPSVISFSIIFNSIAYTTNLDLALIFDTGAVSTTIDSSLLGKTADTIYSVALNLSGGDGLLPNKKLSVTVRTGNPAAGNSPMDVYIWYQILTL